MKYSGVQFGQFMQQTSCVELIFAEVLQEIGELRIIVYYAIMCFMPK